MRSRSWKNNSVHLLLAVSGITGEKMLLLTVSFSRIVFRLLDQNTYCTFKRP